MRELENDIVNQRFRSVYIELEKTNKIKGKSDIASKLGTYNHVINAILNSDRNVTIEQLNKLFEIYGVSADYMFGLSEDMYALGRRPTMRGVAYDKNHSSSRQNIVLVPDRALAGYATAVDNPTFVSDFPRFSVPGLDGDLIAFEISGNSMEPTITTGDYVVCERLERAAPILDNQIYVIVTDVVVAKRVQQIKNGSEIQSLRLHSDNDIYKPYDVSSDDVCQILRVKCRLTTHAMQ